MNLDGLPPEHIESLLRARAVPADEIEIILAFVRIIREVHDIPDDCLADAYPLVYLPTP